MKPHTQILSLARAGNPARAWERFGAAGLAEDQTDTKTLTLKGRLLKDLGDRALGHERWRLFSEASQAYLAAYDLSPDSYPLINAATLALLSQNSEQAKVLAQRVLTLIEGDPNEGETPYWREATRAEALLLLGHQARAEAALAEGIAKLPRAWEDHAATIGQFERILATQGADAAWLDPYRPASSIYFSGLIAIDPAVRGLDDAIAAQIKRLTPGFAFGALAAGADIIIAEAMVRSGALLHVILPFSQERFRELSVAPFGEHWVERFDVLIKQAETVEELWDADNLGDGSLGPMIEVANLAAMGQAMRRADTLRSRAHALTIKGVGEPQRAHLSIWEQTGLSLHTVETQRDGEASSGNADKVAISAVVGVDKVEPSQLEGVCVAHHLGLSTEPDLPQLSGEFFDCLAAALNLIVEQPEAGIGIAVDPVGDSQAHWIAGLLAGRLAQNCGSAQVYSDKHTAMVAKVLLPECRVEEIGEVRMPTGPLTVFAIAGK